MDRRKSYNAIGVIASRQSHTSLSPSRSSTIIRENGSLIRDGALQTKPEVNNEEIVKMIQGCVVYQWTGKRYLQMWLELSEDRTRIIFVKYELKVHYNDNKKNPAGNPLPLLPCTLYLQDVQKINTGSDAAKSGKAEERPRYPVKLLVDIIYDAVPAVIDAHRLYKKGHLTICFEDNWTFNQWVSCLHQLRLIATYTFELNPNPVVEHLMWLMADLTGSGIIDKNEIKNMLQLANVKFKDAEIVEVFDRVDPERNHVINIEQFRTLYSYLRHNVVIDELWCKYAGSLDRVKITAEQFNNFMLEEQKEDCPKEECFKLMKRHYDVRNHSLGFDRLLFAEFLMNSVQNSAFNEDWMDDMEHPFNDYFVYTANLATCCASFDFVKDSLKFVLEQGVRCLHIPVRMDRHDKVCVSKTPSDCSDFIEFSAFLELIKQQGFTHFEYPIILILMVPSHELRGKNDAEFLNLQDSLILSLQSLYTEGYLSTNAERDFSPESNRKRILISISSKSTIKDELADFCYFKCMKSTPFTTVTEFMSQWDAEDKQDHFDTLVHVEDEQAIKEVEEEIKEKRELRKETLTKVEEEIYIENKTKAQHIRIPTAEICQHHMMATRFPELKVNSTRPLPRNEPPLVQRRSKPVLLWSRGVQCVGMNMGLLDLDNLLAAAFFSALPPKPRVTKGYRLKPWTLRPCRDYLHPNNKYFQEYHAAKEAENEDAMEEVKTRFFEEQERERLQERLRLQGFSPEEAELVLSETDMAAAGMHMVTDPTSISITAPNGVVSPTINNTLSFRRASFMPRALSTNGNPLSRTKSFAKSMRSLKSFRSKSSGTSFRQTQTEEEEEESKPKTLDEDKEMEADDAIDVGPKDLYLAFPERCHGCTMYIKVISGFRIPFEDHSYKEGETGDEHGLITSVASKLTSTIGNAILKSSKLKPICPYCVVRVDGKPEDCAVYRTRTITCNGFTPVWDERFEIAISSKENAIISFLIYNDEERAAQMSIRALSTITGTFKSAVHRATPEDVQEQKPDSFIAGGSISVPLLRHGFRVVRLFDSGGQKFAEAPSLFCQFVEQPFGNSAKLIKELENSSKEKHKFLRQKSLLEAKLRAKKEQLRAAIMRTADRKKELDVTSAQLEDMNSRFCYINTSELSCDIA